MKKLAKIFSIVALMFIFVISVKAVAITTDSNTAGTTDTASRLVTNTGTLSITGVESTEAFAYYKVLNVFYNSTANSLTYEFTSDFQTFLTNASGTIEVSGSNKNISALTVADYQALTSGDITSSSTQTTSTLDVLLSKYASYVKTNSMSGTAMSASGTTATATVPVGSYMVLPTTTNNVYAVMAGNVSLSGDTSGWTVNNCSITAKVSSPSITSSLDSNTDADSYNYGDEVINTLTATIPTYPTNATNDDVVITSVFDDDLSFTGIDDDFLIQAGDTPLTVNNNGQILNGDNEVVGTVEYDDQTNTLTVTITDPSKLPDTTITVEYGAILEDGADLGDTGHDIESTLTYSNDPYGSGTASDNTTATATTYGIKIFKKNAQSAGLSGAKIKLCSDSACNNVLLSSDTTDNTTDANGYLTWDGLAEGTYYIQELQAPNGYRADTAIKTINLTASGADATTDANGYTTYEFLNTAIGVLPSTGGIGTYIYTGLGLIVLIGATALLVAYGKRRNQES